MLEPVHHSDRYICQNQELQTSERRCIASIAKGAIFAPPVGAADSFFFKPPSLESHEPNHLLITIGAELSRTSIIFNIYIS